MPTTEIREIRILPPLAIGRLGSSREPMDSYDLALPEDGTGYRQIVPTTTLTVDREAGRITRSYVPQEIQFRDRRQRIRPICPFLEVWAIFEEGGDLQPLTKTRLEEMGLSASDVIWSIEAVNSKAMRRTGDPDDKIIARTGNFRDHAVHPLTGECANFKPGKSIPFGDVQYIEPTDDFPEVRLRFTPPKGKVYGPVKDRQTGSVDDVYDASKGQWPGYYDNKPGTPVPTQPGSIFYGQNEVIDGKTRWVSLGYLDDMSDGIVHVRLRRPEAAPLHAMAHISVGPPDFAPDSLPVRTVSDELKQISEGPEVEGGVSQAQAQDIVRRALETIRQLFTEAMNGNPFILADGKNHNTNNMAVQNFKLSGGQFVPGSSPVEPIPGTGRVWEPIFTPPEKITNNRVEGFHEDLLQQILNGDPAPSYIPDLLRKFDRVGNYKDSARAKMPGLMRNADGMLLALTRRMRSIMTQATQGYAEPEDSPTSGAGQINPLNQTAQFMYQAEGNPTGTLLSTAVSNDYPGLEFDYRSIWRHAFVGVTMNEVRPLVIAVHDKAAIEAGVEPGMLMVSADGDRLWTPQKGPRVEGGDTVQFQTHGMEWSNSIATVIQKTGQHVECQFAVAPEAPYTYDQLYAQPTIDVELQIRSMFDPAEGEGNAVFGRAIAKPGDLTQGLCSPWQNDYRECACYYWAAARPDFVNRTEDDSGELTGDNWLQKDYDGQYKIDDRTSESQLEKFVSYTDLFRAWESVLPFIIGGEADPDFLRYRQEVLDKLDPGEDG